MSDSLSQFDKGHTRLADWDDPQVQAVYSILLEAEMPPNKAEHWEGYTARRIVAALASIPSSIRHMDRDDIIAAVESYFGYVRKLGGDTGKCSAASWADFLLYRANTDNFDPAIAVSATLSKEEAEDAAKAIRAAMVPSGPMVICRNWNVLLAKLDRIAGDDSTYINAPDDIKQPSQ